LLIWENIEVHFIVEATLNFLKGFGHTGGLRLLLQIPLILGSALFVSVATLLFLDRRFINCGCSYFNFNSFPLLFLILISFLILLLDNILFKSLALLD
jgi:Mn2+/Fe2+ NRAMP family transporter